MCLLCQSSAQLLKPELISFNVEVCSCVLEGYLGVCPTLEGEKSAQIATYSSRSTTFLSAFNQTCPVGLHAGNSNQHIYLILQPGIQVLFLASSLVNQTIGSGSGINLGGTDMQSLRSSSFGYPLDSSSYYKATPIDSLFVYL